MHVRPTHRNDRPRRAAWAAVVIIVLVALLASGGLRAAAAWQETTPEAEAPAASEAPPIDVDAPHAQVIAHGLVIMPNDERVWRVREVALPAADDARSEEGGFSFTLQRAGAAVVRNDVTEKRARLEPGEAFFASADDPYTRHAESADSIAWIVELVAPGTATDEDEGEVVFTSETMAVLPQGVHDVEMVRDVLLPGEEAVLGGHVGPGLVLATDGDLEVVSGDATDTLSGVDGLVTGDTPTLRNTSGDPVVYVAFLIGEPVRSSAPPARDTAPRDADQNQNRDANDEPSAARPTEEPDAPPAEEPSDEPSDPPADEPTADGADADGDGLTDAEEAELTTERTNPDTDGDGLEDGREVKEFGTDPFYADTDGDGTSDGDEVNEFGTDPNDPTSVP